jgi:hypothetical protein
MKTIEATAVSTAPRDHVWALVADASTWSTWGSWSEVGVEGGGEQRRGSVRVLRQWPFRLRERITAWQPSELMSYELLDGMNVRGYRSTVTLADAPDGGTTIHWESSYERADPLTALILHAAVPGSAKRLAQAASA